MEVPSSTLTFCFMSISEGKFPKIISLFHITGPHCHLDIEFLNQMAATHLVEMDFK